MTKKVGLIAIIKKWTDINQCLTDPANQCLNNVNR